MNNKEYWIDRAKLRDDKLEKDLKKIEKKLKKNYKDVIKEINKELAYLYSIDDLTDFKKFRIEETIKSINAILDKMYTEEEKNLEENLTEIYKDTYKNKNNIKSFFCQAFRHGSFLSFSLL